MGNNKEIRQRMETYRGILLVLVWVIAAVGMIGGFVLMDVIGGFAAIIIIISIILGIIGHFFVNVALAIPFILLNNGDMLEALKRNIVHSENETSTEKTIEEQVTELKQETVVGNNQLKLIRLKSVVGSALLLDVKVDNQNIKLENGEEKIINVENGKHTVSASFNNDYEKFEFEINNNSKVISIFIKPPLKIQEI